METKMTRRDFEMIADTIKRVGEVLEHSEVYSGSKVGGVKDMNLKKDSAEVTNTICDVFADKLRETNPQFDRERFLNACKVKEPIKEAIYG